MEKMEKILQAQDVRALLTALGAGADPNMVVRSTGGTPMLAAIYLGWEEGVEALLKAGADVTTVGRRGYTCMHSAAVGGHLGILRLLVDAGSELEARDKWGNTPLMRALGDYPEGVRKVVHLLLDAGADRHNKNDYDVSPWESACNTGNKPYKEMFESYDSHNDVGSEVTQARA